MTEYVYGVVENTARPPTGRGIAGAPIRVICGEAKDSDDRAAALVSAISDQDLRLGREEVLTHARVLADALTQGTVLPLRFGTVMEGPEEIRRRLLGQHASELRRQLNELSGKVEMRVLAVYEEDALMTEVVAEDPRVRQLRSSLHGRPDDATYFDRIELGRLVSEAVEQKRAVDASLIIDQLAPVAEASQVDDPAHERVVLGAAFLVERDRTAQFDSAVERVAKELSGRVRFKLTGPLPPHSFVVLDQEV